MQQQFLPGQTVEFLDWSPRYCCDQKYARVEGIHFYPNAFGQLQEVLTLRKLELADHYRYSGEIEYRPTTVMIYMVPAFDVTLAVQQEHGRRIAAHKD